MSGVCAGSRTVTSSHVAVATTSAAPSMWSSTSDDRQVGEVLDEPDRALGELDRREHGGRTAVAGRRRSPRSANQQADGEPDEQEHQVGVELADLERVEAVARRASASPACGPEPVTTVPT